MQNRSPFTKSRILLALFAIVFLTVLFVLSTKHRNQVEATLSPFGIPATAESLMPQPTSQTTPVAIPANARTFDTFRKHPFVATKSSASDEWTSEDGRSPDVIRQLAHNELEVDRLMHENSQIKRRQLVYLNHPITRTIQEARALNQSVESFTLPGLDGQEYDVEVTLNNVHPEQMFGSLSGHLKDSPASFVSVGFANGYEAYDIISPNDGIYIVADAREPGEVMVKQIDPDKYQVLQTKTPDYILQKK
jgi:hypothetical protein